ncbi:MAG: apolipoprotein N-acyltransferase, partial [Bacteroidia bacterium]
DYVVFPETALVEESWEDGLEQTSSIKALRQYLKQFPKLKIIIGASTNKSYKTWEKLSSTARKFGNGEGYYDSYNTGLQLDHTNRIQIYHKSKLVPGVEQMPLQFIFKYFDKLAIAMGGTTGSLGTQKERTVFVSPDSLIKVAPVICYESIYGEFVTRYIKKGAQFISIITNDGWWGDTPGYRQHLKYGALRAIENRRWIVRSANTGTSCFISPLGEVQQATKWWQPVSVSGTIELNNELTFYTRFGDYIGRIAMYTAFSLIICSWLIRFRIIKK